MYRCGIYTHLFLFVLSFSGLMAQQEHKLLPSDGTSGDVFGTSVNIHSGLAIIGAPGDGPSGAGSAYIFNNSTGTWIEMQKPVASDAMAGDAFGTSVAIGDSVAVVGAPAVDDTATDAGAVYIFKLNGSNWTQSQKLMSPDHWSNDAFGRSVALKDSILCIGAYNNDAGASNSGAVYIYRLVSGTWQFAQKLSAFDANVDDFFGYSVALDDSTVVVGAYLDDDNGINSGSVYVFSKSSATWSFSQKLTASNGASGDAYGFSVAISSNYLCAGAYASDMGAQDGGAVYLYTKSGNTWIQDTVFHHNDAAQDDWFGFSLALSANALVCGAFHRDDMGSNCGALYVYSHKATGWMEELKILASDAAQGNHFGLSAAIDGYTMITGADGNDDNASNSGAAYIFPLCTWDPGQQICSATVDSSATFNIITWNKPATQWIDSFLVTRNTGNGFQYLATTDYSNISRHDDMSTNPQAGSSEYRINTYNMCSTLSDSSNTHQTIRLNAVEQANGHVLLTWNSYLGFSFSFYRIWRDSTGSGNWELIAATLNTQHSFTDQNPPSTAALRYLVEVQRGSPCQNSPNPSSAISNTRQVIPYGINTFLDGSEVRIFPNPVHDHLSVRITGTREFEYTVCIRDHLSLVQLKRAISGGLHQLDIGFLPAGHYLLTISNGVSVIHQQFVKY